MFGTGAIELSASPRDNCFAMARQRYILRWSAD
jgi:hypothetical protein